VKNHSWILNFSVTSPIFNSVYQNSRAFRNGKNMSEIGGDMRQQLIGSPYFYLVISLGVSTTRSALLEMSPIPFGHFPKSLQYSLGIAKNNGLNYGLMV
jgi:hypothetical protein